MLILIKYGELTTKKKNRKMFINLLQENIKLLVPNIKNIKTLYDRMYIESDDEEIINNLQNVFGIHSFTICHQTNTNSDDITNLVLNKLGDEKFSTFKVETKRGYKLFPQNSLEFSKYLGGMILKKFPVKVDVHNPEIIVNVEIQKDKTTIYFKNIMGLGGYPVGIQGKGLLMLSGGIDSPVAGYLALKRGINIMGLYFESRPHTSLEAREKVVTLANKLNKYSKRIKLLIVPFTKLQEEIYKKCPKEYNITIMRRMMYRISEQLAKKYKCLVLVNGESIGQVASQTLTSMSVINNVTNMPIIRPVACLDKIEIINLAKKIDTYETSILPYEDCCTIFVPEHPVINPKLKDVIAMEKNFNYQEMIEECVKNTTIYNLEKEDAGLL